MDLVNVIDLDKTCISRAKNSSLQESKNLISNDNYKTIQKNFVGQYLHVMI